MGEKIKLGIGYTVNVLTCRDDRERDTMCRCYRTTPFVCSTCAKKLLLT